MVGPNGTNPVSIPVDNSASNHTVQFTVVVIADNPNSIPVKQFVQLHEEPGGVNLSGGTFSWDTVEFQPGRSAKTIQFHVFCPGNSVVGADQVQFGCSPAPNCLCSGEIPCPVGTPCSCFQPDGTPNDPNSNLGGTATLGYPLPAEIHAEVASSLGGSAMLSHTVQVTCQPPPG
jgi:hypothetical protein